VKLALCLLALVGVGLLAGCGTGGDSNGSSTKGAQAAPNLSKAQFIKRADRLCAQVNAVVANLTLPDLPDAYKGLLQRMQLLGRPDDAAGLKQFTNAGEDITAALENVESATTFHHPAALGKARKQVASAKARFAQAAKAYGFKQCGRGAST
jgi:hypothetical protein